MDSRGDRDAAYIRKVIKTQRYLEMGSRAVLLFTGVKVKGFRPAWWIGTAGLSVAKILENMEIGHNVMHGQWDWMRDPKIHSTAWEWDNACPSSQWKHSHNEIHHTFTNVLGRDNDLGYGILRVDEDQKWSPFFLFQPIWHVGNALLFEYSIAAYDLELGSYLAKKKRMSEEEKAKFRTNAEEVGAKIKRQATKRLPGPPRALGRHRLGPHDLHRERRRQPRAQRVDQHDHHLRPLPARHRDLREDLDRRRDPRRVVPAPDARVGQHQRPKAMHVMTGNLSHQIEHHLFPDMPSNRYAEIAPRIRDLMERHDLALRHRFNCPAGRVGLLEGRPALAPEQGRGPAPPRRRAPR